MRAIRFHGIATLLCFALVACGDDEAKTIKLGVIYPETGTSASDGIDYRAGAELARDIINQKRSSLPMTIAVNEGIESQDNATVELVFKDDGGNADQGVAAANALVDEDGVVGILASYQSAVTQAVSQAMNDRGVPVVNAASTAPTLTTRGLEWFWRTTPHDRYFVEDLFKLLNGLTDGSVRGVTPVAKANITRIGAACENTAFGSNNCALVTELAARSTYGYTVVANVLYNAAAANLDTEIETALDTLLAGDPQVILLAGYDQDTIKLVQGIRQRVIDGLAEMPQIIWGQDTGISSQAFRTALGSNLDGIISRSVFLPKITETKAVAADINALYKERTSRDLNSASARSFTGIQTWATILEKARTTNAADIQQAANTLLLPAEQLIVPWAGVKFSSAGDVSGELGQNILGSGVIYQYQRVGGEQSLEIIYPFDLATADMQFPLVHF